MKDTCETCKAPLVCGDVGRCMSDPVCVTYSRNGLIDAAKAFMVTRYGTISEQADPEEWYRWLGMLVDFIGEIFPDELAKEGGR